MGIFDQFKTDTTPLQWQPRSSEEAWAASLYALAMHDGHLSEPELDTWTSAILQTRQFSGMDLVPLVRSANTAASHKPWSDLCVEWAGSISDEVTHTVFVMACEIAMRDGLLQDSEKVVLEKFAAALRLSEEATSRIVEVSMWRWKFQLHLV
jgi:uncharacterized tellurite resistance protein B-like protein